MQKVHLLPIIVKNALNARLSVLFAALLIGAVTLLSVFGFSVYSNNKAVSSAAPKRCCSEVAERRMLGTYYNTKDSWTSELVLNNKGPATIAVTPILYASTGERYVAQPVPVAGRFSYEVDLNALAVTAGPRFTEGSLEFTYTGRMYEIGGGIRVEDEARNLIFDEQMRHPDKKFQSQRYEVVFAIPRENATVRAVLTNMNDQSLTISGDLDLILKPHEMRTIGLQVKDRIGSMSLRHDGAPASLLALIQIEDAEAGFSATVDFEDPTRAKSPKINGAGIQLGNDLMPYIAVRNIASSPVTVGGKIPYSTWDGGLKNIALRKRILAPGESASLQSAMPVRWRSFSADTASLEIEHDGAPGSVIVSALTVSSDGDRVFTLPLKDAQAQASSTGGYPWFIENDYWTVVYLTNTDDKPQEFTLDIAYPEGLWGSNMQILAPGETRKFDVWEIRDGQIIGSEGNTIPLNARMGHVSWSAKGPNAGNKKIVGRSQAFFANNRMATSYECTACPCPADYYEARMNPSSTVTVGEAGDTAMLAAQQRDKDCHDNMSAWYNVTTACNWSALNPAIATVSSLGEVTAESEGLTSVKSEFSVYTYSFGSCMPNANTVSPSTAVSIAPPIPHHLEVRGDTTIVVGGPCTTGDMLRREVQYRIVNKNNRPCGVVPKKEMFPGPVTTDCTSPPSAVLPTICNSVYELPGNIFIDRLQAGCDNTVTSQTCGFHTFPDKWQWCPTGGPDKTLASLLHYVRRNLITVDGSEFWATGHFFCDGACP